MKSDPKRAGLVAIAAALLAPSWWVLPQVLAGLGLLSLLSTSCLFWLERLQPVFITVAVGALAYQGMLVHHRPSFLRTRGIKVILWASIVVNVFVLGAWLILWFRYQ